MYRLVNVPTKTSNLEIQPAVEGDNIYIICAENGSKWRDGKSVSMTEVYVGDHMFKDPAQLRTFIGRELADAIRLARDAGYEQAMADLRTLLRVKYDRR